MNKRKREKRDEKGGNEREKEKEWKRRERKGKEKQKAKGRKGRTERNVSLLIGSDFILSSFFLCPFLSLCSFPIFSPFSFFFVLFFFLSPPNLTERRWYFQTGIDSSGLKIQSYSVKRGRRGIVSVTGHGLCVRYK